MRRRGDPGGRADCLLKRPRRLLGFVQPGRPVGSADLGQPFQQLVEVAPRGGLVSDLAQRRDRDDLADALPALDSVPGSGDVSYSGVGDIQLQLYVTPSKPGAFIYGVGPVFSFPTATAPPLRSGTWAAGVGVVGLTMKGPWVLGALLTQSWPLSDTGGEPKTDLLVFQPAINYNFGGGWAMSFSPAITANVGTEERKNVSR